MSKKGGKKRSAESLKTDASAKLGWLCGTEAYETLCTSGYTRLADSPEVQTCVGYIAELVGSMTLHLMQNTDTGDVRVRNELSRKLDINPNRMMTRKAFMTAVVKALLLEGNGNAVVYPHYRGDYLEDLELLKPSGVSFADSADGYAVRYKGREYPYDEVIHFTINPDPERPYVGQGYRVALGDLVHNLKQSAATRRGFLESKWKPSVIIRVDSNTEELSSKEGRESLLEQYVATQKAGQPWIIPSELMEVDNVKPLTLTDLAINESTVLDRKAVAGIFGVPPSVVGAGEFKKEEYNNFIRATIMPLVRGIEQELTNKLLVSHDMFLRFNPRSLYAFDLLEQARVGCALVDRAVMDRNELRDWIGMCPRDGLSVLAVLENYIPFDAIGDQEKLAGGEASLAGKKLVGGA